MKIALVYDRVNKWGGAEQILVALHKIFPDAPLYTSVYNAENTSWAKDFTIKTSFIQKLPFASTSHEYYATLMPIAFESLSFDEFDVVVSVTSEAAKGIITLPHTMHLCICLTPTRYLWSGYKDYFKEGFKKTISRPFISYLQKWDLIASQRPDYYIAISGEVQRRIEKYYKRNSDILYPPVLFPVQQKEEKHSERFFLVVSRLVGYKKIDLAIKAAKKAKVKLKIVGVGRDESYLKKIAGDEVEFLGGLTDEVLSYYYRNCAALVFPGTEDFGLVMVEANRYGKPVIAYKAGGALEIIQEGITGEFFDKQEVQSLAEKLAKFDEKRYNSKNCLKNAERFSYEVFEKSFRAIFEKNIKDYFTL